MPEVKQSARSEQSETKGYSSGANLQKSVSKFFTYLGNCILEAARRCWKVTEDCRKSQKVMESHGKSRKVTESHGKSRKVTESHGKSWKVLEDSRRFCNNIIESYRKS